jgi:hypothetical protein
MQEISSYQVDMSELPIPARQVQHHNMQYISGVTNVLADYFSRSFDSLVKKEKNRMMTTYGRMQRTYIKNFYLLCKVRLHLRKEFQLSANILLLNGLTSNPESIWLCAIASTEYMLAKK